MKQETNTDTTANAPCKTFRANPATPNGVLIEAFLM